MAAPSYSSVSTQLIIDPPDETHVDSVMSAQPTITMTGITGTHDVSVELTAPDGTLFQRSSQSVADADTTVSSFMVPVAGSAIETLGLTGTWIVRYQIDGMDVALARLELDP